MTLKNLFLTFIALLAITGCSSADSDVKPTAEAPAASQPASPATPQPQQARVTTTQPQESSSEYKHVSKKVGLGDTLEAFVDEYGTNLGDSELARFKNDYIQPMFVNDKAKEVRIQFESTDTPRRKQEDAWKVVSEFIPTDAKRVGQIKADGVVGYQYESDLLAKAMEKEYKETNDAVDTLGIGKKVKPGTFYAYLKFDKNGVFTVVAGIGTANLK